MVHHQVSSPGGVHLDGVSKRFGSLQVLQGVDLRAEAGEIHAVVGENGAGKTTLMRILAGLERADSGQVTIGDTTLPRHHSPAQALAAGVGLVPQHCEVAPGLSVLESVSLGSEPRRWGLYDGAAVREKSQEISDRMGFAFAWDSPAASLGMAQRQRLELVRLLARDAKVLILDEPTTVLTAQEVEGLFEALQRLAAAGKTVLFITHKLDEVRAVADDISVLRGGVVAGRLHGSTTDNATIARLMIGELSAAPVRAPSGASGDNRLELHDVSVRSHGVGGHALHHLELSCRAGEIVGIAGVEGNGQQELVEVITGIRPVASGSISLDGRAVEQASIGARRAAGLAVVPADRMHEGANLQAKVWETATATLPLTARGGFGLLRRRELRRRGGAIAERVGVTAAPELPTSALSGGNIQRLVVGRELDRDPGVVVLAHPTRGVDVRGIAFIHQKLFDLRAAGKAVLVLSADLDELTAICDRIAVLADGRLSADFTPGELDAAQIGILMAGADRVAS